jgi:F420H(2)-dependent quinone reductase
MPAASRNAVSEFFFRIHPWIYRKTGGRLLGQLGDDPILLLNTIGRRSGQPRTNGMVYVEHENGWIVAASWAGEPKHPIWYLNLMAQPDVTVQVRDRVVPVRARNLEGEERDHGWEKIIKQDPSFAEYETRTNGIRQIPVVLFEPHEH